LDFPTNQLAAQAEESNAPPIKPVEIHIASKIEKPKAYTHYK
jgi:hypothetical protein